MAGLQRFSLIPTVSNGAIYAASDVVGGRLTLSNLAIPGAGIRLHSIVIGDKDAQTQDFVLTIFDTAPTAIADNAAITTLNDADPAKIIYEKIIDAATYRRSYTANAKYEVTGLDVPLVSAENTGSLYAFLWLLTGTPTYSSITAISLYLGYSIFE